MLERSSSKLLAQLDPWSIYLAVAPILYKLVTGIGILVFFWFVSRFLRFVMHRATDHLAADKQQILRLLFNTATLVVQIIGGITALGTMGVDVRAIVASLGLSSFALSFALKDALSNLLAGILVLIYQPFKVGDSIQVSGFSGRVINIDLRYISLQTDGDRVLIPNSSLLSQAVVVSPTHK